MSDDPTGDLGPRDPDQPTKQATDKWRAAMRAEFTPDERHQIRVRLGLVVVVTPDE